MDTITQHELKYTGPEYTGNPDVDRRIDELRKERNKAADRQMECQNEIDKLFLEAMLKIDIAQGDYIYFDCIDSSGYAIIGRVADMRRLHDGVSISMDLSLHYTIPDKENGQNLDFSMSEVRPKGYTSSITVLRRELDRLRKSSREEFTSVARRQMEEILSKTADQMPQNQLKLNL